MSRLTALVQRSWQQFRATLQPRSAFQALNALDYSLRACGAAWRELPESVWWCWAALEVFRLAFISGRKLRRAQDDNGWRAWWFRTICRESSLV